MDDRLRLAKREFYSQPSVDGYCQVQRLQLQSRSEAIWPCQNQLCSVLPEHECPTRTYVWGSACSMMTPPHDLVEVPAGDALWQEVNVSPLVKADGTHTKLHCCTRCGGVRKTTMRPNIFSDAPDLLRRLYGPRVRFPSPPSIKDITP